ncbi:fluoride efflux transporter CrcB [Ectothiorhodospira lacustris]|uniref:fluoride efflux transporter CrcB n=1 Tax=Ectothiorhodospira lacustris TaxID=2899127 RepID=UPI001EE83262|nr:fluoride efflux transporter CrcB [Ectothiorhodospira lacustris]MCG5501609.1 fluoride efflux transporter CrcB [Ectothiorhodospira lacustris]MCG5511461.1 fluoride efflux transporter CrcB [Ectothiorhodospira lacustris]MCG5523247.1 fluoride efflux transporter CrcB [Ectothiorhodospira lacustris]
MADAIPSVNLAPLSLTLILLGGALGGLARYWMTGWVSASAGVSFPWGTLVVNVSGALLIGMAAAAWMPPGGLSEAWIPMWAWLVVGILGSYTTVSSFSLQTLILLRDGRPMQALLNILLSVTLCLSAAALAYTAVRGVIGRVSL